VAVQLVWRHPQRREVEMVLYITMRMVHLRGWRRVVVAVERDEHTWLGVELAPETSEDNAKAWAATLDDRYRRTETIEELLAMAGQWNELYVDGGVAGFLGAYERQMERDEETRRRARDQRR
jgi:hypothetical protein